jgi:MoaA/NifB/PqqE/SkfB family radical SAM enzyme
MNAVLTALTHPVPDPHERLPLITLYLTERCNSRCVTCDYWRHGRRDATLASVERLLPDLAALGTRVALLSGGEPLLNPEWQAIAGRLRAQDIECWLLTSGLSLAKHAARAAALFRSITVSLDGTCAQTYAAIRGLDAFDKVCEGIRAAVGAGATVGLRVTLQRANYRELPRFVALARELGVAQISFLAVDVSNPHAFARVDDVSQGLALGLDDLPVLDELLTTLERELAADFRSGLIAESPAKLRRLRDYFAALCGLGSYPAVRCNAPDFSAVLGVDGQVSPCFFIPGPQAAPADGLRSALGGEAMTQLRREIRARQRPECARCVCSMYRTPAELAASAFPRRPHAV